MTEAQKTYVKLVLVISVMRGVGLQSVSFYPTPIAEVATRGHKMNYDGDTRCPACGHVLDVRVLADVLRKANDVDTRHFECTNCDRPLVVRQTIVRRLEVVEDR